MICAIISYSKDSKLLKHGLCDTYDIIYHIDYDLNYDSKGQTLGKTYDIAVCRIVVVSP